MPFRLAIPSAQPLAQSLCRNPSPLRFPILPLDDRSACPNLLACRPPFQDCLQSASAAQPDQAAEARSEEHTSELQSLMRNSYAVFCLKKKKKIPNIRHTKRS